MSLEYFFEVIAMEKPGDLIKKCEDMLTLLDMEQVLERIINDLEVIIQIENNYISRLQSQEDSPEKRIKVEDFNQVTFSFLFLTLCKYIEFYDGYKSKINLLIIDGKPKEIRNHLIKLNIRNYRNNFVGHILDDNTKRPLSPDDHQAFFDGIDKEHKSFYAFWLKLDNYHFTEGAPLLDTLKELLRAISTEYNKLYSEYKSTK